MIILTSVDEVYKNYKQEDQTPITSMNVAEAKNLLADNQFGKGSMLPKIEAAILYLEKVPSGSVLITSLGKVSEAIKGKAGTVITA